MARTLSTFRARARALSDPERAAALACGLAGCGLLALAARLWEEWGRNPDLSHGFLALPAVVMLWIRAREDAAASPGLGPVAQPLFAGVAGAGLLGSGLLATVYAVALGWESTPTLFLLGAVTACALGLAVVLASGRAVRWIAPGWPAWVMPPVVLLSAPLPPGSYARLTAGLQEMITVGVVETLRFVGVPALRMGNVINLGTTSVGVEEACSGVRSLVSCVLAGLVLSALMLRSPVRRLLLAGLAAPLALATNFARSLTLTLLARNGVDIAGAWHDGLGFAVLGLTTVALAALAVALEESPTTPVAPPAQPGGRAGMARTAGERTAEALILAGLSLAAVWFAYVAARTEASAPAPGATPELARLAPTPVDAGWVVVTRDDLGQFTEILRTDHLIERVYAKKNPVGGPTQITVYAAWWPAGAASVSTVAAHTPDACWPGTGWSPRPEDDRRCDLALPDGRAVLGAEQRTFVNNDYPQHVWFWHLVAREPMRPFDPRSWREQLRLFFRHGVRRDQEQAFVRISSNRPWAEIAHEPLVSEVLAGFAELGVPVRAPQPTATAPAPR